jgi:acyl dehydratase
VSTNTLLSDEVRAFLHRSVSYVAPEEIGRASFRYFATAIGARNRLYVDPQYARAAGYRDVIAPPTLICETNQYVTGVPESDGYIGHTWKLPLESCSQLRGGNEYEFFQEVYPDDVLHVTWEIVDLKESKTSSGRAMLLVRSVATYTNQRDELLVRNTESLIYLAPVEDRQ